MKKGVALIWAVVLCAVLMLIATIITTAVVKESQFSVRIDSSVKAYSAATSGIEWGKYCLQTELEKNSGVTIPDPAQECLDAERLFLIQSEPIDSSYRVGITKESDGGYLITSTGTVGSEVKRVVQYKYKDVNLSSITVDGGYPALDVIPTPPGPLSKSFVLSYDFWVPTGSPGSEFGFRDNAGNIMKVVYDPSNSGEMYLETKNNGVTKQSHKISLEENELSTIDPSGVDKPYRLRVEVKYLNNNSITLTLKRRYNNPSNPSLDFKIDYCSARTSLNLAGTTWSPLTNFNLGVGVDSKPLTDSALGDGDAIELFTSSGSVAYIDNIVIADTSFDN